MNFDTIMFSKRTAGAKLRWDGLFTLDHLRGGTIRRKLDEDKRAWEEGTSIESTKRKIRDLIRHAVATTDFYKDFNPEEDLSNFPIVNKDTFRQNYDRFRSTMYLNDPKNREMSTSGSTGTPFTIIQDQRKAKYNTADGIFLGMLANYRIGDRMAFFRVWVKNVRMSKKQMFIQNSLMIDSSDLSDEALLRITNYLIDKKVECIVGYSSAFGVLIDYLMRTGVDASRFSVKSIIPISESMPDPVRRDLKAYFKCPVQAWYSNEENGIMGVQYRDSDEYYINSESYYYEILKMDSDEPAEDGELGRIVITDLGNYAFPLIRYENGDTAVAKHQVKDGRYRLTLTELYGRRSDLIFDTKGNAVTPYVITNNLWNAPGIRQFQFIQKGRKDYDLHLNGDRDVMDIDDILSRIKPAFGEDANIKVTFVDEIPVLASGKRKYICNESTDMTEEQRRVADKVY